MSDFKWLTTEEFRKQRFPHIRHHSSNGLVVAPDSSTKWDPSYGPGVPFGLRKDLATQVISKGDKDDDPIHFIISSETPDRDDDIIRAKGWNLKHYKKNPVVLFAHDGRSLPVGKSQKVWKTEDTLESEAIFTPKDLYPFGHMVGQFYRQGFLKATSVGFRPLEFKEREMEDEESRGFWGPTEFMKQELLEYSSVPVPAHPEALIQARSLGIDCEPLKDWAEQVLGGELGEGRWLSKGDAERIYTTLAQAQKKFFFGAPTSHTETARAVMADQRFFEDIELREELGVTMDLTDKGTISFRSAHPGGTPAADEGATWNGPSEVAAAEVSDLKVMATWFDSAEPDLKGSYKLSHHLAAGTHSVVLRGVNAAIAVVLGARDGVDIPEDDRRGVFDHLAKHLRDDFDRDPPEFRDYTADELSKLLPDVDEPVEPPVVIDARVLAEEILELRKEVAAIKAEAEGDPDGDAVLEFHEDGTVEIHDMDAFLDSINMVRDELDREYRRDVLGQVVD